jgi:hypothetical protein
VPVGEYTNLSVRRFVREELDRLRSELGVSDLNDLLILLVRTYREHTNTISKTVELLTNIASKVDELLARVTSSSTANPTTSSVSPSPSLTDKSVSNPPSLTDTSVSPTTSTPSTPTAQQEAVDSHIWCRKKSEVRNFKGFLDWVDHSFELLDWWEEDDKYCFETRKKPEKGRRGGGE